MPTTLPTGLPVMPRTSALRRALSERQDSAAVADLLYLEAWELRPQPQPGVALRIHQIRRANPSLAAEIRAELAQARAVPARERTGPPAID